MRFKQMLLSGILAATMFAPNSFAAQVSNSTKLMRWVKNHTSKYSEAMPSPSTSVAAINLPIRYRQLRMLDGNALLLSTDLSRPSENASITWQDGTQSIVHADQLESLLQFLEHNSLGMPVMLIPSNPSKKVTANFGGIDHHGKQLFILLYNTSEKLDNLNSDHLLIQMGNYV